MPVEVYEFVSAIPVGLNVNVLVPIPVTSNDLLNLELLNTIFE